MAVIDPQHANRQPFNRERNVEQRAHKIFRFQLVQPLVPDQDRLPGAENLSGQRVLGAQAEIARGFAVQALHSADIQRIALIVRQQQESLFRVAKADCRIDDLREQHIQIQFGIERACQTGERLLFDQPPLEQSAGSRAREFVAGIHVS